ncbi:hypothetical protein UFOVP1244_123 [uncultured Caudovirales phage]|uniref:Uncharacterized protein n=1 Tax=uncultured Caudovirales phage TaxID=2100421 RepID=A0A6J5RM56_9CAUD|nr:hypothetical protein UFOVP1244_123 [uncultured Caudovirales phage]
MALIVTNHRAAQLRPAERQQAYNALDVCLTLGIARALLPQLAGKVASERTYTFERAMQAPAMTMALRGIAVDEDAARIEVGRLLNMEAHAIRRLRLLASVWTESGTTDFAAIRKSLESGSAAPGLNPYSHVHVKNLFYGACGEEPYHRRSSGTPTADDSALRMLMARSPTVGVMAGMILEAKELRKWRNIITESRRSRDGRLRCAFSVGASASGAWTTGASCLEEGLNFYGVPPRSRGFLVPSEPGMVMLHAELQNPEVLISAKLAGDAAYAADIVLGRQRRPSIEIETLYGTGERKLSKMTGAPVGAIKRYQERFFAEHPLMAARIENSRGRHMFASAMGRWHRHVGHPDDQETLRTTLGDEVRGIVSDVTSVALWRLWRRHDVGDQAPALHLLSRDNGSLLLECREADFGEAHEAVSDAFQVTVPGVGVIPVGIAGGRNWREAAEVFS